MPETPLPRVVADTPLSPDILEMLAGKVEILDWPGDKETVPADAVYAFGHPIIDGPFLDRLPGVRVISNYGVGVDHIDLPAAAKRGLPVGNTPGVLSGATADMAFTLLLAAARRLVEGDRYARGPEFLRHDPGYMLGLEVHGKTLGIVGFGRIGQEVARRAQGFDMKVLYHARNPRPEAEKKLNARKAPLNELLAESDFVVLLVPLTNETRGMIGKAELARMKSTAILVNIARGPIVDLEALTDALRERRIYAAGLDVTEPEPLPRDHPILKFDNLVIAPHLGSATVETRQQLAEISVENLLLGLAGKPLRCPVTS